MKNFVILILLFISSCKEYNYTPFKPFPKKYTPKNSYERLKKALIKGDKFSKELNSYMSGPTSYVSLSEPYSPSPSCNLDLYDHMGESEESAEIERIVLGQENESDDQMNGFPLSIASKTSGSIKGEPQVLWDECKGIKSNYDDGDQRASCKKRTISKEYINFFDDNFASCVQAASKGYKGDSQGEVEAIKFSHAGITGDTSHSSRSYHSVNRAMDIRKITFIKDGKTETIKVSDQKKSPAKEFFQRFRKCWNDKIVSHKSNCPGNNNKGSIGHEDKNHQHHLHLSLPYCPRKHQGTNYYYK